MHTCVGRASCNDYGYLSFKYLSYLKDKVLKSQNDERKKEIVSTNRDDNGDATGDGAPDGAKKQQDYLVCKRLTYCLGQCVNFSPSLRNLQRF